MPNILTWIVLAIAAWAVLPLVTWLLSRITRDKQSELQPLQIESVVEEIQLDPERLAMDKLCALRRYFQDRDSGEDVFLHLKALSCAVLEPEVKDEPAKS